MNRTPAIVDLEAARQDPAAVFAEPGEIVRMDSIGRTEKLGLLRHWEREARALSVAEEEGMTADQPTMLSRVRLAIQALDGADESGSIAAPDKHGGDYC
jgi:hypothetical protein